MIFKAHFLNVGCADCTILEIGNEVVVIDCGYRRFGNNVSKVTSICDYLMKVIGKMHIDLLIISHPHHDHYLGMEELIGKVSVHEFWGSPYKRRQGDSSLAYEEWREYCSLKAKLVPDQTHRFTCTKNASKEVSVCTLTILGPRANTNDSETRECHDACLSIWVHSPANEVIICGDASDSLLDQIRNDWNLSPCTILHASHHGSENGADLEFIKAVNPRDTIISTQSGIFENVPSNSALQRYRIHSKQVFRTDLAGTCTAPLWVR